MIIKYRVKGLWLAVGVMVVAAAVAVAASVISYRAKRVQPTADAPITEVQEKKEGSQNILFLGTDRQAGLCDVIMLANIDFDRRRITVAQLPRDTYAAYTQSSYRKLNGAYNSLGGAAQVAEFLSDSLGIDISHYICMGLDTVGELVDAVGGIEIDIPQDMKYSDPEAGLYIDLPAGKVCLDAESAEQFLRYRSGYADGDLGRIDAQKLFVCSFLEKLVNELDPIMTARLCAAAQGIETDLKIDEWLGLGIRTLSVADGELYMLTLPGEELTATVSGASYYCLSAPATEEIMKEYFGASRYFDKNKVFLNSNYSTFKSVYGANKEYFLLTPAEILEEKVKK